MIEINLLPEELRLKTRKTVSSIPAGKGFDPTYLIYALPIAAAVILLTHIYFGLVSFSVQGRLKTLNKEWAGLETERRKIVDFKSETEVNSQDSLIIDELTNKSIRWSEKLNRLSLDLPPGVWFNDIAISRKSLEIKATVFSLESNGVDLINRFLYNLKNDKAFFKDFISIETGNMVAKKQGSYEVMDFTLSGALKTNK